MPAAISQLPVKTAPRETGHGGKPPVDRRPTGGGGGGGGDDDWHANESGPGALLRRMRLFLLFGLSSDMVFFFTLAILFFVRQTGSQVDPRHPELLTAGHPIALPHILYLSTSALLLSCASVEMARRRIFREIDVMDEWLGLGRPALKCALPWLATTLGLGLLFLAGQWMGWQQLCSQGFPFDKSATSVPSFYYLIVGVHALHLLCGVVALLLCLTTLWLLRRVELRQVAIDVTGWYWHAMGASWILLLALLTFAQ